MKRTIKLTAVMLIASLLLSSCIGPFRLTNNIKDWNEGVSRSKFVNELLFVALHIVPVYPLATFADAIVLNSIHFWTGKNVVADTGTTKTIENAQGQQVLVTSTEQGYTISNGEQDLNLVYDEEERIWSAQCNDQTINLIQLIDDNSANLFVGEDVVEVTLDEQGINQAIMHATHALASLN